MLLGCSLGEPRNHALRSPGYMGSPTCVDVPGYSLRESVQALTAKHHTLDGLNRGNLFSHISGSWKCKFRVPALSGLAKAFSLCPYKVEAQKAP